MLVNVLVQILQTQTKGIFRVASGGFFTCLYSHFIFPFQFVRRKAHRLPPKSRHGALLMVFVKLTKQTTGSTLLQLQFPVAFPVTSRYQFLLQDDVKVVSDLKNR